MNPTCLNGLDRFRSGGGSGVCGGAGSTVPGEGGTSGAGSAGTTDTMPLSLWAKTLMAVQSMVALSTTALVVARAVNVLAS
jgi:hypothetical protein